MPFGRWSDEPLENTQSSVASSKIFVDAFPTIDLWRMEGDGPLEDVQSFVASGKVFVDVPYRFLFKCICFLLDIECKFNPVIGVCIVLTIIRRKVDRANAAPDTESGPTTPKERNEHKCNLLVE
ncbi:hypothetical protein RHSIM_Rhsim05G0019400 [Rhododendron simsii]|uniref:Uncharacterized protein n=1 Tax=Rhododendron simsii TaxID=118357 RepID=A0A834H2M2_RHOSS|nr:hypothetical protein RHSIM_Rhsim05G0019400 [Rhododendron simsii]